MSGERSLQKPILTVSASGFARCQGPTLTVHPGQHPAVFSWRADSGLRRGICKVTHPSSSGGRTQVPLEAPGAFQIGCRGFVASVALPPGSGGTVCSERGMDLHVREKDVRMGEKARQALTLSTPALGVHVKGNFPLQFAAAFSAKPAAN